MVCDNSPGDNRDDCCERTRPAGFSRAARGSLIVLSGPSGVGKDAVLAPLFSAETCPPRLRRCITATTRAPRAGEVEGVDYFFLSREEFERRIAEGFFLEHASYAGRFYGTPRWWVEAEIAGGNDVLLKIDVQGALQVRCQAPEAVLVFIAPPSEEELERQAARPRPGCKPRRSRAASLDRPRGTRAGAGVRLPGGERPDREGRGGDPRDRHRRALPHPRPITQVDSGRGSTPPPTPKPCGLQLPNR